MQVVDAKWYEDEKLSQLASGAGHAGGDFWVACHFLKVLRGEEEPMFDIYRAVAMSATAVLALRSAQNGGREFQIPDFRDEAVRAQFDNDTASPFPDENGHATLPCCSHPGCHPTAEDIASATHEWREAGLV